MVNHYIYRIPVFRYLYNVPCLVTTCGYIYKHMRSRFAFAYLGMPLTKTMRISKLRFETALLSADETHKELQRHANNNVSRSRHTLLLLTQQH